MICAGAIYASIYPDKRGGIYGDCIINVGASISRFFPGYSSRAFSAMGPGFSQNSHDQVVSIIFVLETKLRSIFSHFHKPD